jgi:hypothetical protein
MKTIPFLLALAASAGAQERGIPALAGIQRIEDRFGPEFLQRVFEMTGAGGDPQPLEWRITTHDPVVKSALHEFWIGGRRATDEGLNDDFYPERLPKGFFNRARLKLDSTEAFALAEGLARESRIGFDLVNYKLHCREYSDEPVWTLTLLDDEEEIVGSVHVSAETGNVIRTAWFRRMRDGRLIVQDSAAGAKMTTLAGNTRAARTTPPDAPTSPTESEFGVADEEPPPDPAEPNGERPAARLPGEEPSEIPEIRKLNEAQEKAFESTQPQPRRE